MAENLVGSTVILVLVEKAENRLFCKGEKVREIAVHQKTFAQGVREPELLEIRRILEEQKVGENLARKWPKTQPKVERTWLRPRNRSKCFADRAQPPATGKKIPPVLEETGKLAKPKINKAMALLRPAGDSGCWDLYKRTLQLTHGSNTSSCTQPRGTWPAP